MDKNGGPSIYLCENLKTNILNSSFEENIKDVRYTGVDIINFSKNFRSSRDSMNLLKNCDFKGSEKNIIFNMSNLTLVGCNLKKHHKIKENGGKLIVLDNSDEFEDFNTLIHSGEKNILLNRDYPIFLDDEEIDVDGLCIDGKNHEITGNLIITGKNVLLKNIIFKNTINIEDGPVKLEDCSFEINEHGLRGGFLEEKHRDIIINKAELTLKNCNFKKDDRILNTGEVTIMDDDEKEVFMSEIISLKNYGRDKDDDIHADQLVGGLTDLFK